MNFYKWTHGLRIKLLLLAFIPIIALFAISIYSISIIENLESRINTAYNVRAKLISKAISQLDQVTQQNIVNSIETAHASNALADEAKCLNSVVDTLAQTVDGKNIMFQAVS